MISDFLWNGKKPRIALRKLCASKDIEGLALPNMELYNIAFEMNKLTNHWTDYGSSPSWVKIKKELAAPFNIVELLSQKKTDRQTEEENLILQHSRWAWARAHKTLGISQYRQGYSSIWNNPSYMYREKDMAFGVHGWQKGCVLSMTSGTSHLCHFRT